MKKLFAIVLALCSVVPLLSARVLAEPAVRTVQAATPAGRSAQSAGPDVSPASRETVPPRGTALPLKRIVFYSNGVAYFERRGRIQGDAEIKLPFRGTELDDVLKSLLVLDLGRGRIESVEYEAVEPPAVKLAGSSFRLPAGTLENDPDGGLAGALRRLQGCRVALSLPSRELTGRILTVSRTALRPGTNQPGEIKDFLLLASDEGGLHSLALPDIRSVRLLDEENRRQLNLFAETAARLGKTESSLLTITSRGEGSRELMAACTVAAPVWKASYRMVAGADGRPFLQGWALVDNTTDEDWEQVMITLVSGSPASTWQQLSWPLYRHRPQIQPPGGTSPFPQEAPKPWLTGPPPVSTASASMATELTQDNRLSKVPVNGKNFPALMNLSPGVSIDGVDNNSTAIQSQPALSVTLPSDAITRGEAGVSTEVESLRRGELFEYRVAVPVTIRRHRSALVPIVQTALEGERVSRYSEIQGGRPKSGWRLHNTSGLVLEQGPVVLMEGEAFGGESTLPRIYENQKKFIPFAEDLDLEITSREVKEREPAFLVKAGRGAFQAHHYEVHRTIYAIRNHAGRAKILYIEHPVEEEWEWADGMPKPVSRDDESALFRLEVPPGGREPLEFTVSARCPKMDTYQLDDLTAVDLEVFQARGYLDEATGKALRQLVGFSEKTVENEQMQEKLEAEAEALSEEQERLRDTVEKLGKQAEARILITRYLTKMDRQENRLEEIAREKARLSEENLKLGKDKKQLVANLLLERKLPPDRQIR